jgi:hypothetical protein
VEDCLKLSVWSGPRNVSTALMYAFRQRPDTLVVDEPLYGHYLKVTRAEHPGDDEVLAAMDTDGGRVVREVLLGPCERPVHFFKNMAHHLAGLDRGFLAGSRTSCSPGTRPRCCPPSPGSYRTPPCATQGCSTRRRSWTTSWAEVLDPVVLDAKQLLLDPPGVLRSACDRLGIPFHEAMLRWPAGPKPEDGVWAKHWYANVHASTGSPPTNPGPPTFRRGSSRSSKRAAALRTPKAVRDPGRIRPHPPSLA